MPKIARIRRIIAALVLGFCTWVPGRSLNSAGLGVRVWVAPASAAVAVGEAASFEIRVADVSDACGVDVLLSFDPDVLQVQDADDNPDNGVQVEPGTFWEVGQGLLARREADNSTGQVRYVFALLAPLNPASGDGVLLRITFRAKNAGDSALELSQVLLADRWAESIPLVATGGVVVVGGTPGTPSATITASATATTGPTASLTPISTATGTKTATATRTTAATATATATVTPTPETTVAPTPTGSRVTLKQFLPVLLRTYPVPTPTPMASPTESPTPSPTATVTPVASPTSSPQQLIQNSSFEVDAGWELVGGSPPTYSTLHVRSGARALRLGIAAPVAGAVYSSARQVAEIPSGARQVEVRFYWYPVGWPMDSDEMYLYVHSAIDEVLLWRASWMEWNQAWHVCSFDLSELAGQRVRLWLGVRNDGQGQTAVYVDDLELWVTY